MKTNKTIIYKPYALNNERKAQLIYEDQWT